MEIKEALLDQPEPFERLRRLTEEHVRTYMEQYHDCSHDWSHVQRVRRTALEIAAAEQAAGRRVNERLVELSALLHDVGDAKYIKDPSMTTKDVLMTFMESVGYPRDVQDAIVWIVERISFRHELAGDEPPRGAFIAELYCVQDADRLEAIGAIGIARCFAYNGARQLPLYEEDVPPMVDITATQYNQLTAKNKGNARNHFYEKLLKIFGRLKTDSGRQEGRRRHQLLKLYIAEFDRECHLSHEGLLDVY